MAQDIVLPGGHLIIRPNPIQQAQEEAKLRSYQQAPDIESAKLGLAFRQLMQQTDTERARAAEESRYHTGTLQESAAGRAQQAGTAAAALAEQTKYHEGEIAHGAAALQETAADREARTKQATDALKANQFGDILSHLGPQLMQSDPKTFEAIATAYGSPIGQVMAASRAEALRTRAAGIAELNKNTPPEKFGAVAEVKDPVTGQVNTELRDAAWTHYKAQHGDKAAQEALKAPPAVPGAPPVSAGTTVPTMPTADVLKTAGATPTFSPVPLSTLGAATPNLVRTEDRGLVKPSMGIVAPGGGVLPIPGATPGKYGETETPAATPPPATTTVAAPTEAPTIGQRFGALIAGGGTPAAPTATPPPPTFDIDKALYNVIGGPSMEDLERRRRALAVVGQ